VGTPLFAVSQRTTIWHRTYAQEARIRAIRALPTFRGEARFSTWLHRIAVNSALEAVGRAETRTRREAPDTP